MAKQNVKADILKYEVHNISYNFCSHPFIFQTIPQMLNTPLSTYLALVQRISIHKLSATVSEIQDSKFLIYK